MTDCTEKAKIAMNGFRCAWRIDTSVRWQLLSIIYFIVVAIISWPLSLVEVVLLVLCYFLVVSFELINTAIETALDRLHPERHEMIGASKDIMSSAVCMAGLFAIFYTF